MRKLLVLLFILVAFPAAAATLKISTWNLEWLTTRQAGDPRLPRGVQPRTQEDWTVLAGYAHRLAADVVAFEEVASRRAAARLFPPDRYNVVITHDPTLMRVGFAIRRGIAFHQNPDVSALVPYKHARYPLRSGADVTLELGGQRLRLLAVHLKAGCWYTNIYSRRYACRTLEKQIPGLRRWIAERDAHGTPFVVLGDFNRVMDGRDRFHRAMDPHYGQPEKALLRADAGMENPCWGGHHFTDHVFLGGPARGWLVPHSLRVLVYQQTNPAWKDRLSDHCPVSVQLNVP